MTENDKGLTIRFEAGGNSSAYCRAGWSTPEPTHTWATGPESVLELPEPSAAGRYLLVLELWPFVWQEQLPSQRLMVMVNDNLVGEFQISGPILIKCVVPWWLVQGRKRVAVTFRHPDAATPRAVKGVPDDRLNAFAFESVSFAPDMSLGPCAVGIPSGRDDALPAGTLTRDQLMTQFESLGESAELGLLQRQCGGHQSGLLSLASASLPALLAGLNGRFSGMGDPKQIDLHMPNKKRKCLLVDKRFGFFSYPEVRDGETEEDVRAREAKALALARLRLIGTLEEAKKIFVYSSVARLADPVIRRLLTAVRAYGPATLLWVETGDESHRSGTVESLGQGLLKGYVDRSASREPAADQSIEGWNRVCHESVRIVREGPVNIAA